MTPKCVTLSLAAALVACNPSAPEPAATATPTGAAWTVQPVTPDVSDGVRILVLHDMEGLSGQSDPNTYFFGMPEYPSGQEMLAADINAVIEGLYAGGATEVHVVDGHGSGNPEPDVRRDLLDQRATQIIRETRFDSYFDLATPGAYDGVAVVGMHAKTGSGGFASHTITLGIGVLLNGQAITETELVAASWGRHDIPVIFGSGDDRLAADLATMPWLEFVTVKTAVSADSAVPRPVAEARADLTAAATRAVENLRAGRTRAIKVAGPLEAGVKAVYPASLAMLDGLPGINFADSTVTFPADSLGDAYRIIQRLVGVARAGYTPILTAAVAASPGAQDILRRNRRDLVQAWFDYESGRWTPPAAPAGAGGDRFHGPR